ncbi:MAG TPA: hypothetical protein VKS79_01395, partial [Gemmataceae bacterium]|nr:hypothetical protein [Gemmataceae bacterium]
WMLPAVGQGALGLECRSSDEETKALLSRLDHHASRQGVLAERAVLRALGGGCQVPLGVHSHCSQERGEILLTAAALSPDGTKRVAHTVFGRMELAEELGSGLAQILLRNGAEGILAA